ncbi:carboxypeptidase inhibitor SmCI [Plutella xylostella]|uniref:carboxypeptidase inhibitor SmCI n=1 Tax=Plutella xylostella TaxID=51655 RepID=UPI0020331699|nr:carboxypeptidase inhibitor SmCI [Plutella xylostella]
MLFLQVIFLFGYLTEHTSMAYLYPEYPDRVGSITDIDPACLLPPERGMCKARMPRYYFDPKTLSCSSKFIYGGCHGNGNRFLTELQCKNKCFPARASITDIDPACILPPETGMCKARTPRYYFDSTTGSCSTFIYGGCGGNGNRFLTEEQCKNKCLNKSLARTSTPEYCQLSFDYGDCHFNGLVLSPRWYYDPDTASCKVAMYSGCGGNGNRFDTEEDCYDTCAEPKPTNKLPKPSLRETGVSAILGSEKLQGILENIFRTKTPKNLMIVFDL